MSVINCSGEFQPPLAASKQTMLGRVGGGGGGVFPEKTVKSSLKKKCEMLFTCWIVASLPPDLRHTRVYPVSEGRRLRSKITSWSSFKPFTTEVVVVIKGRG